MRSISVRRTALVGALTLLPAALVVGAGFHFEDDFNRDAWTNAQTNIALPPWSTPTKSFTPVANTPFDAELRVVDKTMTIFVNGEQLLQPIVDNDLQVGTVGLMDWGMKGGSGGLDVLSYRLEDGSSNVLFNEDTTTWNQAVGNWRLMNMVNSNGVAYTGVNAFGRHLFDGSIIEDSNGNVGATTTGANATPRVDCTGPAIAWTGAGSTTWTDYELRCRLWANDNDGIGLLVRVADDTTFYRVTFMSENNTGTTRPPKGVSVQRCLAGVWTQLFADNQTTPAFNYATRVPFDVSVKVQTVGNEVHLDLTIINDPDGANQQIVIPTIVDNNNPILAGTVGLYSWGNDSNGANADIRGSRFSNFGGVPNDLVRALDNSTLAGDAFTPADTFLDSLNWISTHVSGTQAVGHDPTWFVRFSDAAMVENSDGRKYDGGSTTGGVSGDGQYKPYILVKGPLAGPTPFSTGANYTIKCTMMTPDNDGMGIVFGFKDEDNYFRLGWRIEASGVYGFRQGMSMQKIVGGVITDITPTIVPSRANQAGIWIKKFATGTIEQADNQNLRDNSGRDGIEWVGSRLVRGEDSWTNYTFESWIEANDNWGIGLIFRYQSEDTHYRLTFNGIDAGAQPPTGIPKGVTLVKVDHGVYTELFRDTDDTKSGDNDVDATAGFIYTDGVTGIGYRIFRPRVIVNGGTIKIEIDADDGAGNVYPNYYTATVVDPAPLTHGKVGLHTWNQNANEFRNIKLTLAGQPQPEFEDGVGTPDEKGWIDATLGVTYVNGITTGTAGVVGAGAPISGIGHRIDLDALSVRDNRWVVGTYIIAGNNARGCANWDGPRAVVGAKNWKDYTFKVDMRTFDNDGIGAIFRYKDEENFYRIAFLNEGNNGNGGPPQGVSVQKRLNGNYTEVFYDAAVSFVYDIGQRWTTEVTCTGSHFDIKITEIDGPRAGTIHNYSFDDPTDPILMGRVGVTCWGADGVANEVNTILGGLDWTKNFAEGAVWDNVVVDGTKGTVPPDLDEDGFINQNDVILWTNCFTGPDIPPVNPPASCQFADVDVDGDVDQTDFAYLQRCLQADGVAIDPTCVED